MTHKASPPHAPTEEDGDGPHQQARHEVVGEGSAGLEVVQELVEALRAGCSLAHSHSMVPGGLLVTSRVTRLTSATSFVMRVEILASTS